MTGKFIIIWMCLTLMLSASVISAQDSLNVTKISTLHVPWGTPIDVELNYPNAYISAGWGGIGVIDVNDPYNPQLLGTYPLPGWAGDITLSGNNLIVEAERAGFYILDITDPASIEELCHYHTGNPAVASDVQDSYAYIVDLFTLYVIDITDPASPRFEGSIHGLDLPCAVLASGNYVFITFNFAQSVHVFDVSDPEIPTYASHYGVGGPAMDISINDDISYVSHSFGGFHVDDVSDPEHPVSLSQGGYGCRGGPGGMEAVGSHLFTAGRYSMGTGGMFGGLQIFDTTDPENLVEVGYYNIFQDASQVEVHECYAYMTEANSFSIYDCSDVMPVVSRGSSEIRISFSLLPPHPNPFNPTTTLTFSLPVAGHVDLNVFDVNGRNVGAFRETPAPSQWYPAGIHHILFDGSGLASGVYLVQMEAGEYRQVKKMVLLK